MFEIENARSFAGRNAVFSLYLDREALPAAPGGVAADVVFADRTWNVSRLEGESGWTIDGEFLSNGFPVFFNGVGTRFTIPRVVTDSPLVAALDAATNAVPS